jgi:hypothetical protein
VWLIHDASLDQRDSELFALLIEDIGDGLHWWVFGAQPLFYFVERPKIFV